MNQEIILNAFLVKNDVRNAFMLQPINYKELDKDEPTTSAILNELAVTYPELIQSECYEGIILSKFSYKENKEWNSEIIGEILGYPSCKEFKHTIENPNEDKITFDFTIELKTGEMISLFCNVCTIEHVKEHKQIMQNMADKATVVLQEDPLFMQIVKKAKIIETHVYSIKYLINKIMQNKPLTIQEIFEVNNYIWNLSMEKLNEFPFDYTNPFHKGVVLTLLTHFDNNPLEPFYPLQYHKEENEVNEKIKKWEKELLTLLEKV
jgi:hypothetical protein